MQKVTTDPSEWLASLPDDVRGDMVALDNLIVGLMPEASRTLWEGVFWGGSEQTIIGYGDMMMTQSRGRTVEWFMVGLARQKAHISIYVNAVTDGQYVVKQFGPQLGKVRLGAASIGFRKLADVDVDTLRTVIAIANDQLGQT